MSARSPAAAADTTATITAPPRRRGPRPSSTSWQQLADHACSNRAEAVRRQPPGPGGCVLQPDLARRRGRAADGWRAHLGAVANGTQPRGRRVAGGNGAATPAIAASKAAALEGRAGRTRRRGPPGPRKRSRGRRVGRRECPPSHGSSRTFRPGPCSRATSNAALQRVSIPAIRRPRPDRHPTPWPGDGARPAHRSRPPWESAVRRGLRTGRVGRDGTRRGRGGPVPARRRVAHGWRCGGCPGRNSRLPRGRLGAKRVHERRGPRPRRRTAAAGGPRRRTAAADRGPATSRRPQLSPARGRAVQAPSADGARDASQCL